MRIGITGASGLLGSLLAPHLAKQGHRVIPLVRSSPSPGSVQWASGARIVLTDAELAGMDAVVHLAGENVGHRWTRERKRRIRASRVEGTRALAERLAEGAPGGGPRVLVSASAVGYYGDRGDEILNEASPPGSGFLAEVCQGWEAATIPAEKAGLRVVRLRVGLPLTRHGGVLGRMLLPFRLGLGGRLGGGMQWMSWIAAGDLVQVFARVVVDEGFQGPVNAVGPNPARNREVTQVLGQVLHRPALLPVPAIGLRLLFGQMARETILSSARVEPVKLREAGFQFAYPELRTALAHELEALR